MLITALRNRVVSATAPLTREQIREFVPAAFATGAAPSMSGRYRFIGTSDIIDQMESVGFLPFSAQQTSARTEEAQRYAKHMVRFRHGDFGLDTSDNPGAFEVCVINSMNGSTGLQVLPGIFRFICENGLIIGDQVASFRTRHIGSDVILDEVSKVVALAPRIAKRVGDMRNTPLSNVEQHEFAQEAIKLRFPEKIAKTVEVRSLMMTRRDEDKGDDLWTVYNRVQEHLLAGGVSHAVVDGKRRSQNTTRALKDVTQVVRINQGLWNIAEAMLPEAA